jgi:hypothetical protein
MTLAENERSEVCSVSGINETQALETKCTKACWSNYPLCKAHRDIPQEQNISE